MSTGKNTKLCWVRLGRDSITVGSTSIEILPPAPLSLYKLKPVNAHPPSFEGINQDNNKSVLSPLTLIGDLGMLGSTQLYLTSGSLIYESPLKFTATKVIW